MKAILTIIKKEFLDTLRDRRTLMVTVVMPLLIAPLMLIIVSKIQSSANDSEARRTLKVGYIAGGEDFGLQAALNASDSALTFIPFSDAEEMQKDIRNDSLDIGIVVPADFASTVNGMETGQLQLYFLQTEETAADRIKDGFKDYKKQLMATRLDSLHLTASNIKPVDLQEINLSSIEEVIGKYAGGFLPYLFIAFCFMGCMYPAIDLFTGEKERGSIETILSTPIHRWKILVGKLVVVILSGFNTAFLALVGLFLGLQVTDTLPPAFMDLIYNILSPAFIVSFLVMLLPMTTFFAGMMVPVTTYAKSFKEAQSILTPLNFLVILPAIVGMFPGIELNVATALVPVLNVVLTTKELIAGTLDYGLYALTLASLLAIAALAVTLSVKRFGNEKNILRT